MPDETRCRNLLACPKHTFEQRRDVEGRSTDFGSLVRLATRNAIRHYQKPDLDTQCSVVIEGNKTCLRGLWCMVHSKEQQHAVTGRSLPFAALFRIQATQQTDIVRGLTGYGLVAGASTEARSFTMRDIRRRYRRNGFQLAAPEPDNHGEIRDPSYTMLSPAGEKLNRIRQILYDSVTPNPERSIDKTLPSDVVRDTSGRRAEVFLHTKSWHFAFVPQESRMRKDFTSLQDNLANGAVRDSCIISVPSDCFNFSDNSARCVLDRLRKLLARVPFELQKMGDGLKRTMLLHAMHSHQPEEDLPKMPFVIKKAVVDNIPALLMDITCFEPVVWTYAEISIALPIHNSPKNVAIPPPQGFYAFFGQAYGEPWLGVELPRLQQKQLFAIAAYIVSTFHLRCSTFRQVCVSLATMCHSYEVAILVKRGSTAVSGDDLSASTAPSYQGLTSGKIAEYNPVDRVVRATREITRLVPWVPNITGIVDDVSGHLVVQTINMRYLHTLDWLIAWSDGANAADIHRKHGTEQFSSGCMCSAIQAKFETHDCVCGASIVCESLARQLVNGLEVRLCPKCRAPDTTPSTFSVPDRGSDQGFIDDGPDRHGGSHRRGGPHTARLSDDAPSVDASTVAAGPLDPTYSGGATTTPLGKAQAGASQHDRGSRRRQSSSEEELGSPPRVARGEHTGDVSSARRQQELRARETSVELREGALERDLTQLQHDRDDLATRNASVRRARQVLQEGRQKLEQEQQEFESIKQQVARDAATRRQKRDDCRRQIQGLRVERTQRETAHRSRIEDLDNQRREEVQSVERFRTDVDGQIAILQAELLSLLDED